MASKGTTQVTGKAIWMDGALVPWDDAQVHVLTHTLHYGLGVFEGIRCYRTADGRSAVFRLGEHVRRLFESAHINLMAIPFTPQQIEAAILETLRANGMAEGYIRPLAYIGHGAMGLNPGDNPIRVAIATWPWGKYLGDEGMELGIRAKVSSFSRHHVNAKMTKGKTCGDYVNSILAKREALLDGYDEAILLDTQGLVSEASGENIFVVRGGEIRTPPLPTVLDGITRGAIVTLARDKGIAVAESPIARDELYIADEVFMTGTAAEVTPVREIDRRQIGEGRRGPITKALQAAFFDVVAGKDRKHEGWLTYL
ncbi:MAG: branched chain amino acid aminotransferase [Proteobacteria bacterium]|nr:MAG: branched chain amino acid aminotransferase [Pseudomonadota bacterium]